MYVFSFAIFQYLIQSTHLFEEYGPDTGNPATDPPPEWIKGPGLYDDWRLIDPDKPGNYYPMVTERLKYCMYAIAPLTIITAMIMLCDGYQSVREFQAMKRGKPFHELLELN